MDSIVNKLTEIEDAASAIVQHAEDQMKTWSKRHRHALILSAANWRRRHPVYLTVRADQVQR